MEKEVAKISRALLLVGLWFVTVYLAFEVWLPSGWAIGCGFINALIGSALLVGVTWTEEGAKVFYEGAGEKEGWLIIAVMWSIPVVIFFLAIIWWGVRFIFQLLGWWRF